MVRTIPGAISAIISPLCSVSAMRSATRRSTTIPTAGKAGIGARSTTGATRFASVSDLRHGRGLLAELRHDRVLGCGPREHQRLLRRAGRYRAPAMAEEP